MNSELSVDIDNMDKNLGYLSYYGEKPKSGWLLNYFSEKNEFSVWSTTCYFVDNDSENFKITLPHYPSFIIEYEDDILNIEEYIKRKYEGAIFSTEIIEKFNLKEFNHLVKPPKNFFKVFFRSEVFF